MIGPSYIQPVPGISEAQAYLLTWLASNGLITRQKVSQAHIWLTNTLAQRLSSRPESGIISNRLCISNDWSSSSNSRLPQTFDSKKQFKISATAYKASRWTWVAAVIVNKSEHVSKTQNSPNLIVLNCIKARPDATFIIRSH
jgi:hypothetical protein